MAQEIIQIPYEKFTLENGLEVVLHQDKSDPMVAVATVFHVGSNREKPGKTGFAHFFEHMAFNDSENVPRGWNRKAIPEWGGSRNGGTWSDGTIYYEVVPKDAFEKIMWIDSDRLGYMINTVTTEALEREKQVVKNEKRQRVDNSPYGFTDAIIRKHLYPKGHPYSWTVIGELEDLQNATLEDVKEFYSEFYGPNNATLVIAGDIDLEQTKKSVIKWFGEIKRGKEVPDIAPMPVTLNQTKKVQYQDDFAKLPELRMIFPTVEEYHKDSYALSFLASLLVDSKETPLYRVIVEEEKLAPSVSSYQSSNELAGEFIIRIRAKKDVDLDEVKKAIEKALLRFESTEIKDLDMQQIKAQSETSLYRSVETILNKAFSMATNNEFAGNPSYITQRAKIINQVSKKDVWRVYNQYIKNKNYLLTSVVPKGKMNLAVSGSTTADVKKEIVQANQANEEVSQGKEAEYQKTPTKHNRSEPDFGKLPKFKTPTINNRRVGVFNVFEIQNNELPLVEFSLNVPIGSNRENTAGVAAFVASMLSQGTKNKTPKELEKALNLLGASVSFSAQKENFYLRGSCLSKNFNQTLALVQEMITEPRWDEDEFNRIKQLKLTRLKGQESQPVTIGFRIANQKLFGNDYLGMPTSGTQESVAKIQLTDLIHYYKYDFVNELQHSPTFNLVGNTKNLSFDAQLQIISDQINQIKIWDSAANAAGEIILENKGKQLFFIDFPDAKQSTIILAKKSNLQANGGDPILDFANEILGGGSSGRLFQTLRIEKGYTYGAYSFLRYYNNQTAFYAYTNVRSNATKQSLQIIQDLIRDYAKNFGDKETEVTKSKILKSSAKNYESLSQKLEILEEISTKKKPFDFIEQNQSLLSNLQPQDFKQIINQSFNEQDMIYIVVGDKKTQFKKVQSFAKETGKTFAELDIKGNPVPEVAKTK